MVAMYLVMLDGGGLLARGRMVVENAIMPIIFWLKFDCARFWWAMRRRTVHLGGGCSCSSA